MDDPDIAKIREECIRACISRLEKHGISAFNVHIEALVGFEPIRDSIIRQEYYDTVRPGNTEGVREGLAKKYNLSRERIKSILYNIKFK